MRSGLWDLAVAAAIALHFLLFLAVGLSRHWSLLTSINDIGVFDQAIWGLLNGAPFTDTINAPDAPMNWLGFHFNPILAIFVPLYAIAPAPEWLIGAQALAVSLAAWPLYQIARRVSGSDKAGFLWTLAYLLNPFVISAVVWDFHPVTLAVPMIVGALHAIESGRRGQFLGMCLALLLVQEQMGITVAGLGMLWGLRRKSWPFAIGITAMGVVAAALVVGVIMPALSPTGTHPMLASNQGHVSRYNWLGRSPVEIVLNLVQHPLVVAELVFSYMGGWRYLLALLVPFLFFPAAAPSLMLPAIGDLAVNLLSANVMQRDVHAYHSVTITPVLTVAALYGSERLRRRFARYGPAGLAGLVAVAGAVAGYRLAPLPLPGAADFWAPVNRATTPPPHAARIRELIGTASSVSAQSNLGPHFSQRRLVYRFPERTDDADMIVLHLASPTTRRAPLNPGLIGSLSFHLQMEATRYLDTVERILAANRHDVIYWADSWLVLRRSASPVSRSGYSDVTTRIEQLRQEWR